jgi:hypothetical protein
MAAPGDWTGQQVKVGLQSHVAARRGEASEAELIDVNERGVVLASNVPEGRRPVFFPWDKVLWIYPVEEPDDDLQIGKAF